MPWIQKEIRLSPRKRGKRETIKKIVCNCFVGCHLVHREIVGQIPELKTIKVGMANVFCKFVEGMNMTHLTKYSTTYLCFVNDQ